MPHSDPEICVELLATRKAIEDLGSKIDALTKAMDGHDDQLRVLQEAFPEGPLKHREVHIAQASAAKAEEEFWRELKLRVATKGVFGALGVLFALVLAGLTVKLGLWR